MIKTININDFIDEFNYHPTYTNAFSYHGKSALYEYFQNIENESGIPYHLDIIALACDFTEYDNLDEFIAEHTASIFDGMHNEGIDTALEILSDTTTVIRVSGDVTRPDAFIIRNY